MKTKNIILGFLVLIVVVLCISNVYFYYKATRLYANNFLSIQEFNEINIDERRGFSTDRVDAILIGNSITEKWSEYDNDFFTKNKYINASIGGQTSPLLLLRFRNDVIDLDPKVVVIAGGINDIAENTGGYNAKFTLDNIKSMADIAQANGAKVILTSVVPAANIPWNYLIKDVPDKIKHLNTELQSYAVQKGYGFANYYTALIGDNLGLKPQYTIDGVHLTKDAYKVMEPILKQEIDKALQLEQETAY